MIYEVIGFLIFYYMITVVGMYYIQRANDDNKSRCFLLAITYPIWLFVMGMIKFITFDGTKL